MIRNTRGSQNERTRQWRWTRWMLTPAALVLLAGAPSLARAVDGDDALQGPKVKDNSMPGETRKFSPGSRDEKGARMQDRGLPGMAFAGAVRWLGSEQAPAEVRLSDDQKAQIKTIRDAHRDDVKAYVQQHEAELDKLIDELPPRAAERLERFMAGPGMDGPEDRAGEERRDRRQDRREGRRDDRRDDRDMMEPASGAQKAALDRVKELMDGAPKPTEAHAKIAALLTAPQKQALETKVKEIESTMRNRQDDRRERMGKALEGLSPEQREQLKSMSPEERQKFMQERRATKGQGARGGGSKNAQPK